MLSMALRRKKRMMESGPVREPPSPETPKLLVPTLRGQPGGPGDEPQHALMGEITTRMLELLGIPWEYFPTAADQVHACLDRAVGHMDASGTP